MLIAISLSSADKLLQNGFDPDQDQQSVVPGLDPNLLTLW